MALSITRDRGCAEEAAQDTFVKAWRYAASYDPRRGPVAVWLLSIARNATVDLARAWRRRPDQPAFDSVDALDGVAGTEGIDSPYENLTELTGAVRSLPAEQRDVLMAACTTGSRREISEAWDLPLGTVKTRLRLALNKLREMSLEVVP